MRKDDQNELKYQANKKYVGGNQITQINTDGQAMNNPYMRDLVKRKNEIFTDEQKKNKANIEMQSQVERELRNMRNMRQKLTIKNSIKKKFFDKKEQIEDNIY